MIPPDTPQPTEEAVIRSQQEQDEATAAFEQESRVWPGEALLPSEAEEFAEQHFVEGYRACIASERSAIRTILVRAEVEHLVLHFPSVTAKNSLFWLSCACEEFEWLDEWAVVVSKWAEHVEAKP